MPKIKINYDNMIFYKVYCINPNVKKMFIGHTTNIVQRKHILKKQSEIRYSEMFDVINKNGGWTYWRIKEIEKYNECKSYADVLLREKYHYDTLHGVMLNETTSNVENDDEELPECVKQNDKYQCSFCEYECSKNKHFQQHLSTRKHMIAEKIMKENLLLKGLKNKEEDHKEYSKNNINDYGNGNALTLDAGFIEPNNNDKKKKQLQPEGEHKCACGNVYKNMSGLCKHRHTCKLKPLMHQDDPVSKTIQQGTQVMVKGGEGDVILDKEKDEIILQLLKDNESMKTFMKEQNNMLKEMMLQINTNGSSTITTTNNIKQKFNINIFLNEQCKDAINMCDFIKSLKVTFHDLEITRDKSLEESVSTIMLRGLKELDVYKRPIHCTDQKRDVMYIKDEEKWEKDDGNVKLKESIGTLSKKQMFTLKELRDSDPEIKTNDEKKDRFITTMNHVCTPIPELSEKKLIKTIGKEMYIDKDEE